MKIKYLIGLFLLGVFMTSCYKDKGNYTYTESNEIIIEEIPDIITVLTNIDTLKLKPKITSKTDGEITQDNPNYSFVYAEDGSISDGQMHFKALDSTYQKDLSYFVKLQPKNYEMRFVVTDKRTGVQTIKQFQLRVSSSIGEGWMILNNEGQGKRVRMDMINIISTTRKAVAYDVLPLLKMPATTDAKRLFLLFPSPNERLGLLAGERSYSFERYDFSSGPSYEMMYLFGDKSYKPNPKNITSAVSWFATVDQNNDAFAANFNTGGPMFGFPVNNSSGNNKAEFKVSEYVVGDPKFSGKSNSVLFYDTDNKRFMSWSQGHSNQMRTIPNPDISLFDYNAGKNLVYMEGSRYANGTAYAIMEKGGNYSLYGITFVPASPVGRFQQSYYSDLNIPDITRVKSFAFHSTLPYMFYSIDNKIFQFDMITKQIKLMKTLDNEKITMLKFHLFKDNYAPNKTQEYLNQQYQLIVGSSNNDFPEKSRGILRYYDVPPLNKDLTLVNEYKGFADIVDISYREKR